MEKTYIPITEQNMKLIKNYIGMCRLSGIERTGEPSFTFKDKREGLGVVIFDLYYRSNIATGEEGWNVTVRTDTPVRFHDDVPAKKGETYCYLDAYRIAPDSLELGHKTSKFSVFAY